MTAFLVSLATFYFLVAPINDIWPTWWLLFFPVPLILHTMFTLGMGALTARLVVPIRDFRNVIPHLTRMWFYLSPILWTLDRIEGCQRPGSSCVVKTNPMYLVPLAVPHGADGAAARTHPDRHRRGLGRRGDGARVYGRSSATRDRWRGTCDRVRHRGRGDHGHLPPVHQQGAALRQDRLAGRGPMVHALDGVDVQVPVGHLDRRAGAQRRRQEHAAAGHRRHAEARRRTVRGQGEDLDPPGARERVQRRSDRSPQRLARMPGDRLEQGGDRGAGRADPGVLRTGGGGRPTAQHLLLGHGRPPWPSPSAPRCVPTSC